MRAPRSGEEGSRKLLWAALFMAIGCGAATYLHWPALTNPLVYKSDVRQSPHWSAYHTNTFRDDDLIIALGAYNESPVQNLIYYLGTFLVDMVTLGKWLAVVGYGLTATLFFWLSHNLFGLRAGALAALCFTFFPDQFEFWAGGFSKAWMIPIILVCIYLLERKAWRGMLWLMPFAAAAYPVAAVLVGAVALAALLLEAGGHGRKLLPGFRILCYASGLALALLFTKYLFSPAGIGALTPGDALRKMPEMYRGGMWPYLPVPTLLQELSSHLVKPFIVLSAIVFLVFLGRERVWWSRSMTALVLASLRLYLLADTFFMYLYVPNRYTRYSAVVLLALWHGRNWDLVLKRIPWRTLQALALAAVLALGGIWYRSSFRTGKDTSDRARWAPLNRFVSTLPAKVLIAGHPDYMDDIPIQAHRSVLCNHKLAHPWYSEYYAEIRRRIQATFDAYYAEDPATVNRLAREWGVTHLVVVKRYLSRSRVLARNIYVNPYNIYILRIAGGRENYLLRAPPPERVVYEDEELYVLELPIPEAPLANGAAGGLGTRASRGERDRARPGSSAARFGWVAATPPAHRTMTQREGEVLGGRPGGTA